MSTTPAGAIAASQFHSSVHANGVAELVIDRAPVNALNCAGWHGLADEITRLGAQREVRVIVIAAVHGFVLGGGIGICGAADIVVAAEDATFGLPEIDRGAMGGAAHLQRMFGLQKTRYLFFTGESIGAPEALRLGAIERVVPRAELRDTALGIAAKIAAKSPAMVRIAKEALNGIEDGNLEDKYRWEQGFTLQAYMSPDSAETRRAFVEKRDTKF
jgi:enoyl-CoA hydratase